jgi:hypothetical protein
MSYDFLEGTEYEGTTWVGLTGALELVNSLE